MLETPSEPNGVNLGGKARTRRRHVREINGIIWAFIGDGILPAYPAFPFTQVPRDQCDVARVPGTCNWVQLLEGQVDSAHLSFLHASTAGANVHSATTHDLAPKFELENVPGGFRIAAIRQADAGYYTRITQFVLPYWEFIPPTYAPDDPNYADSPRFGVCQVPIDDETSTVWYCMWRPSSKVQRGELGVQWQVWNEEYQRLCNDPKWGQDRAAMAAGHFTGLGNILVEDMAVAESMAPIVDRSHEYLGASDTAVARFRRLYLDALREIQTGTEPTVCNSVPQYEQIQGHGILHHDRDEWHTTV